MCSNTTTPTPTTPTPTTTTTTTSTISITCTNVMNDVWQKKICDEFDRVRVRRK